MTEPASVGIVEHVSAFSFEPTLQRLKQTIETAHMTLFAIIDHAANARSIGASMPPSTVFIYGNPKGGTPLMLADPLLALDLPLRVLVREREDGKTAVAFHPIVHLEAAQRVLVDAVLR